MLYGITLDQLQSIIWQFVVYSVVLTALAIGLSIGAVAAIKEAVKIVKLWMEEMIDKRIATAK